MDAGQAPQQSPFASAGWDCWPRLRRWASAAAAGWWSARWWARGPLLSKEGLEGQDYRGSNCVQGDTRA